MKREARAAARRHKNALRVHRTTLAHVARFEEVVVAVPSGGAPPLQRERLTRGRRQLVVVGASPEQLEEVASGRMRVASLGLEPVTSPPLRLVASIVLAEVSRQVGRRRPAPGGPAPRRPTYDAALALAPGDDVLEVALSELLAY